MRYDLAVLAILKNETHILREWLAHYMLHGVEKFYLLDDNSSDDPWSITEKYGAMIKMRATDPEEPKRGKQARSYNLFLEQIQDECQYVIVVDLDEFLFCPRHRRLLPMIEEYGNFGVIQCPWLNFGSSGHIRQPKSVVPSFLYRTLYKEERLVLTKGIINAKHLISFGIHTHMTRGRVILANHNDPMDHSFVKISEKNLPGFDFRVNHYPIQSWEFFENVKMTRGDCMNDHNVRNQEYFVRYDRNEVADTLLRDLNWSIYD